MHSRFIHVPMILNMSAASILFGINWVNWESLVGACRNTTVFLLDNIVETHGRMSWAASESSEPRECSGWSSKGPTTEPAERPGWSSSCKEQFRLHFYKTSRFNSCIKVYSFEAHRYFFYQNQTKSNKQKPCSTEFYIKWQLSQLVKDSNLKKKMRFREGKSLYILIFF